MQHTINNFQLMSKPTGSVCNIDCTYCFYLEKHHLYPDRKSHWKMDQETLESYVINQINAQQADVVDFQWQGGEPTLMGLEFFKEAVKLQNIHKGKKQINNYFQTNGIRLDEKWARFLNKHNFLVGLSLDGPEKMHNTYRRTRSGKDTFESVMNAVELLRKYQVEFNTLSVISNANVDHPIEVYEFLKKVGSRYLQFIPLVERKAEQPDEHGLTLIHPGHTGKSKVAEWSVDPKKYGQFLNTIFDHWFKHDFGQMFVMNFEDIMARIAGMNSSCIISETCGGNLALEANGDVYSCDHFVYPEFKLGNIKTDDLHAMVNAENNIAFGLAKKENLSVDCLSCDVRAFCNGGCPKHRFELSSSGKPNHNYLCPAYKSHLHHSLGVMKDIVDTVLNKKNLEEAHQMIKEKHYR